MVKKLIRLMRNLRFRYIPLIEIIISRESILDNLHTFQTMHPSMKIAPVLKSNAYGHGLKIVAEIVDNENIPFMIVDSYHEAMILRNEDIRSSILIIGYTAIENIIRNRLKKILFTVSSLDQLKQIASCLKRPTCFHIKIDTGMHRQGIVPAELSEAVEIIRSHPFIILQGMCSHLADADGKEEKFTKVQIKEWNRCVKKMRHEFPQIEHLHLSATSGALFTENIDANVLRLGNGLYGIDPHKTLDLKPALQMNSVVSGIKTLDAGDKVGYNCTFEATKKMTIATIPAGYYEGIDRRLSNKGSVKIGTIFCPIVGRVSMNITTIDVTDVPDVRLNMEAGLISSNRKDPNSIENIAKKCGTVSHEIFIHIPQQLRRRCA